MTGLETARFDAGLLLCVSAASLGWLVTLAWFLLQDGLVVVLGLVPFFLGIGGCWALLSDDRTDRDHTLG